MLYMNELMKQYFKDENSNTRDLAKMIADNTKKVYDCLVYDKEGEIDETRINFDRIIMMCGDRTGFEVDCNEIRLEKEKISKFQIPSFLIELDKELTTKFSRKVVIYISELEDSLELRFHSLRDNEKLWLADNLEVYDNPILCYIS